VGTIDEAVAAAKGEAPSEEKPKEKSQK